MFGKIMVGLGVLVAIISGTAGGVLVANQLKPDSPAKVVVTTPASTPGSSGKIEIPAKPPAQTPPVKPVPAVVPPVSKLPAVTAAPKAGDTYQVQKGDTLSAIALHFKVDLKQLAAWNKIADVNKIATGQVLHLAAPVEKPADKPEDNPAVNEEIPPVLLLPEVTAAPKVGDTYTVQQDDTLTAVAYHFHVSVDALVTLNGLADPLAELPPGTLLHLA